MFMHGYLACREERVGVIPILILRAFMIEQSTDIVLGDRRTGDVSSIVFLSITVLLLWIL